MPLGNRQTDQHALNNFSSLIDKVPFKRNSMSLGFVSMSLGFVVLEKLFTGTWTQTLQYTLVGPDSTKCWLSVATSPHGVRGLNHRFRRLEVCYPIRH